MLTRFYAPDLDAARGETVLPLDEAHHLTRVMRLGTGDEIAVFDGRGLEFRARVVAAVRGTVRIEIVEPLAPVPEPRVPLTLVQALLKGDKMDAVVRDATMMGAAAVQPVITARTIGRPRTLDQSKATDRWLKVAVSSAKQCGRATLPAITPAREFGDWLAHAGSGMRLILVEPSAAAGGEQSLHSLETDAPASMSLIVGPEGGWTAEERRQAEAAGCIPVTLGPITLRADAMAVAAIAIIRFALKDL